MLAWVCVCVGARVSLCVYGGDRVLMSVYSGVSVYHVHVVCQVCPDVCACHLCGLCTGWVDECDYMGVMLIAGVG